MARKKKSSVRPLAKLTTPKPSGIRTRSKTKSSSKLNKIQSRTKLEDDIKEEEEDDMKRKNKPQSLADKKEITTGVKYLSIQKREYLSLRFFLGPRCIRRGERNYSKHMGAGADGKGGHSMYEQQLYTLHALGYLPGKLKLYDIKNITNSRAGVALDWDNYESALQKFIDSYNETVQQFDPKYVQATPPTFTIEPDEEFELEYRKLLQNYIRKNNGKIHKNFKYPDDWFENGWDNLSDVEDPELTPSATPPVPRNDEEREDDGADGKLDGDDEKDVELKNRDTACGENKNATGNDGPEAESDNSDDDSFSIGILNKTLEQYKTKLKHMQYVNRTLRKNQGQKQFQIETLQLELKNKDKEIIKLEKKLSGKKRKYSVPELVSLAANNFDQDQAAKLICQLNKRIENCGAKFLAEHQEVVNEQNRIEIEEERQSWEYVLRNAISLADAKVSQRQHQDFRNMTMTKIKVGVPGT